MTRRVFEGTTGLEETEGGGPGGRWWSGTRNGLGSEFKKFQHRHHAPDTRTSAVAELVQSPSLSWHYIVAIWIDILFICEGSVLLYFPLQIVNRCRLNDRHSQEGL
jgi:hypothetical protein